MADVRTTAGEPVAAQFAGFGAPTPCAPLVVDSTTGRIYALTDSGTVVAPPASGITVTITTAKLTALGANGSMVFTNGVLTSQVAAT